MILGLEIGMFLYGLLTLVTGKFIVTKMRVVTGRTARQLGIILLLPVPIAYTAHGFVHYYFVQNRRPVGTDSRFVWTMIAVEAGVAILCFAVSYGLGWLASAYPVAFQESEPAAESAAPIGVAMLGNNFINMTDIVKEDTGPTLVCGACSQSVRLGSDGRKPPWCTGCGANL